MKERQQRKRKKNRVYKQCGYDKIQLCFLNGDCTHCSVIIIMKVGERDKISVLIFFMPLNSMFTFTFQFFCRCVFSVEQVTDLGLHHVWAVILRPFNSGINGSMNISLKHKINKKCTAPKQFLNLN